MVCGRRHAKIPLLCDRRLAREGADGRSVLTLHGHLEDDLARWAAKYLAVRIGAAVVVTAGVHVDGATQDEIQELVTSARELLMAWAERFAPAR